MSNNVYFYILNILYQVPSQYLQGLASNTVPLQFKKKSSRFTYIKY